MKMPNCAVRALLVLVLYGGFTDDRIPQPHSTICYANRQHDTHEFKKTTSTNGREEQKVCYAPFCV